YEEGGGERPGDRRHHRRNAFAAKGTLRFAGVSDDARDRRHHHGRRPGQQRRILASPALGRAEPVCGRSVGLPVQFRLQPDRPAGRHCAQTWRRPCALHRTAAPAIASTPRERKRIMFTPIRFACVVGIFLAVESFAEAANAGNATHGAQVFNACVACHATDNTTRLGPGLQGIVGRRSGSMPGFRYSRAMKNASITWDEKSLDAYVTSPQALVPGKTMPFSGLPNAGDRADLIAYLETLK